MKKQTLDLSALRVDTFEPTSAAAAAAMYTQVGEATCYTCGNPPRMEDVEGAFRTFNKCCV